MRVPAVLIALLVAIGFVVVPSPAQAAPVQPEVELLTARLGSAGKQVFLRYEVTCPPTGGIAYLAASISQASDGDVDVAREFLEVGCTGDTQRARLVVPVREGRLVPGTALIETTINEDNEPASWRADEAVVANLTDEKVAPTRITSTSIEGLRQTSSEPLDADIDIIDAEILAGGAGVKIDYEARCPADYFTYVFSQVQQSAEGQDVDANGTLAAYCGGTTQWQPLVAVVSLGDGAPFVAGPATVKGVLNNCNDGTSCFLAQDEQQVQLGGAPSSRAGLTHSRG